MESAKEKKDFFPQLPRVKPDDLSIIANCPKLKGGIFTVKSAVVKGLVYPEVPTKALLREHKYAKGDARCEQCNKCL